MSTSKHSENQSAQQVMIVQSLRKTPMFSGLSGSVLESLASGCHLQKVPKDSYLFHEGQRVDGFYVIHHGAINVHKVTESGREQVIRVFYPGESLGEVVIAGDNTYPASAKATEASQVILIPTDFFRAEIQRDPDLAMCVLASMSMHLRYLVETVEGLKLKQAESRVAQWLLRELESHGETMVVPPQITLPLAKHLLASQLGITSETLSRVFARLREAALISIEGKRISFLDVSGLRQFLIIGESSR
ncbi:Crp/Fnr family transcriptional regulator [Coraliomargarita sp. W4R53]